MKPKRGKRRIVETLAGAAVGAAIAGPVGALAAGKVASKVDSHEAGSSKRRRSPETATQGLDDPMIHVRPKRILVPIDFSSLSRQAMRFAREWASLFGAKLYLIHVVEPITALGEFETGRVGAIQRDVYGKAKGALRKLADTGFPKATTVSVIVRKGSAHEQINGAVRKLHADLIIIASHGNTGLKHMLLGSTAERVARQAACPVLILRRRTP